MTSRIDQASRLLVDRVGGYLRNPVRVPRRTCATCTTPVDDYHFCTRCLRHQSFRTRLADVVAPVAYGGHNAQSSRLLYGYKTGFAAAAADDRRATVLLMLFVVLGRHLDCFAADDGPVDAYAVMPSTRGRPDHPLPVLVGRLGLPLARIGADLTTEQPADPRQIAGGRFSFRSATLRDRHVLIVDDTWTTGGRVQSMAVSLKDAGARRVSALILARWLDPEWAATAAFLEDRPHQDFDPAVCPLSGAPC